MISPAQCRALVESPRIVKPQPSVTITNEFGPTFWTPADLEREIKPYEEVNVHAWGGSFTSLPPRIVVLPVDANGRVDNYEWVSRRDKMNLSQFAGRAIVGLTTWPRTGLLGRILSKDTPLPVRAISWFDLIDRETETFYDYDTAFHFVSRLGKLPWIEGAWRGGFRHVVRSRTLSVERLDDAGAPSAGDWIMALLKQYANLNELYIRTIDGVPTPQGRARRYLIRRADWQEFF